jgi:hypothetical protein
MGSLKRSRKRTAAYLVGGHQESWTWASLGDHLFKGEAQKAVWKGTESHSNVLVDAS